MHTIYTLGYARRTVAQVQQRIAELGATLIDTRYNPVSRRPEWCMASLRRTLGDCYVWMQSLGNVNYRGGDIKLHRPDVALPMVRDLLRSGPVILLCQCNDHTTCHRSVAAEWLSQRLGNPVVHLPPPEAEAAPDGYLKVTSLNPPFGTFVQIGAKTIETRDHTIGYRGLIGIHQTSGLGEMWTNDIDLWQWCQQMPYKYALQKAGITRVDHLVRGKIVAVAELYATEQMRETNYPSLAEQAYGWYAPGRWMWKLRDVRALPEPMAARGMPGLWHWRVPEELRSFVWPENAETLKGSHP